MTLRVMSCWLICGVSGASAQTISAVVNAASMDSRLCPGVLAIVTGTNLPASPSTPVTVGGKAAAVVSATATRYTVQLPFEAAPGPTTLQVANSAPFNITLAQYAPAFFTSNSQGFGTVSGTHADGSPINDNYPAFPGERITLLATGLGPVSPPLPTGVPGSGVTASTNALPTVIYASETAKTVSSIAAPTKVGVYEVTIDLTSALVTGTRAIGLSIGGVSSGFGASIPIAAAYAQPVISQVLSATGIPGSIQDSIEAGSWAAVYGTDFTAISKDWTDAIDGSTLPKALGGVRVTFDGKPGVISYVSPTQINVQVPDGAVGSVLVAVTNNGRMSAPFLATVRGDAPAFFQWGASKYAVVTRHPDQAYIGPPSLGKQWVGAKPGDVLILWGTGFGPTTPPVPFGTTVSIATSCVDPIAVTVGGVNARVVGAALSVGLAGVYQVAIEVPAGVPSGDAAIKASAGLYSSPDNVYLFIAAN